MELINCLGKDFDDACFNLVSDIISDNYRVDIIVGIKKGGAIVSKKVYDYIKIKFPDVLYFEVQFQHPTTVWMKNIGIKKIFKYLPCWSLNLLRKMKMFIDEILWNLRTYKIFKKVKNKVFKRVGNFEVPKEVRNFTHNHHANILIIDDALDTGMTISYTLCELEKYLEPRCLEGIDRSYRYAVLTSTYKHPVITPNYTLYKRKILRFPWAFDAFKFN